MIISERNKDNRGIELPMNYEREYKIALDKLHFHERQLEYHRAMAQAMKERVEELKPLTNAHERALERAREAMEQSEEFQEIRKRVRKQSALTMVDLMLKRIEEQGEDNNSE